MKFFTATILTGLVWGMFTLGQPLSVFGEGVKTHYKEYTIFTYGNADYLCEPYEVKKDDWLYKIFRQKGEISASDFPRFLLIFKQLNPQLSNIDAIAPGIQVLIPLKQVNKEDYIQKEHGVVEVPVLEFSLTFGKKEVEAFTRNHLVQKGDTVSTLLGKEFLKKGGAVSELGEKTFTTLNPDIKDINRIYSGAHILIPEPDILAQPWLDTLLTRGIPQAPQSYQIPEPDKTTSPQASPAPVPILTSGDLGRLKRYAQLIQGTLMDRGKVFFPGKKGEPAQILDLSKMPVLEENSGQRTLILPSNTPPQALDQDLVAAMKAYWKGIRLQQLNQALSGDIPGLNESLDDTPDSLNALIKKLISITQFSYTAHSEIPLVLKTIEMEVALGRITHDSRPDILVNTGNVYGKALDALKNQGYDILNFIPAQTFGETILLLFSKLGYETWKDPSFYTNGRVEVIKGIYVSMGTEKHFITRIHPDQDARNFLDTEAIQVVNLNEDTDR